MRIERELEMKWIALLMAIYFIICGFYNIDNFNFAALWLYISVLFNDYD